MNTQYFRLDGSHDNGAFEICGEIIRSGGLVAFPTETVYGLGVSAFCADSVSKVFEAKGRPSDNPLIVHIAYPEDAEDIAFTSPLYYELAERFMPGPLTVILPKKDCIPDEVTAGLNSVGIRCPSHTAAHKLILTARVPIAAPSANISGLPSPTCGEHVMRDMTGKIDAVIDMGEADFGLESTVISITHDSAVILRPGAVTKEDLLEVCSRVTVSEAVKHPDRAGDRPASPGMKYKHYSPNAHFSLFDGDDDEFSSFINDLQGERIGVICNTECAKSINDAKCYTYDKKDGIKELCHNLFSFFRRADDDGVLNLYARLPDDKGQSLALYNRMIRAAGSTIISGDK